MQLKWAQKQKGFTIVELLIIIVVIAILATITVVSYNGAQNRAKTVAGQATAEQVAEKVELYEGYRSRYPSSVADFSTLGVSKLDNAAAVLDYWADNLSSGNKINMPATYDDGKKVVYAPDAGGACVFWWDYSTLPPGKKATGFGISDEQCMQAW